MTRLLLFSLLFLPTWLGCNPSGSQLSPEEQEKKRRAQQESLQANEIVSLPTDVQRTMVSVKPGHWVETSQRFKSTKEDLQVLAVGNVYQGNSPATLPATNFVNEFTRRSNLPKGQEKSLSLRFFVPPRLSARPTTDSWTDAAVSTRLALGSELLTVPMMSPILESGQRSAANELRDHEYQLVVLSPQALAYQHWASLDVTHWYADDDIMANERIRSYEVCLVEPIDNQFALPHSLLTMTSIAAIVWDDVALSDVSSDQQKAILDWLHWGGQLIISGPTSWSRLQNSFIAPYLPSHAAEAVELGNDSFAELSSNWITQDLGKLNEHAPIEIGDLPISGLKMQLSPRGSWLPGTGELVAECRVGRGRIAVTAFSLREPKLYRWPYYSSFVSTGLLRRWPREFRATALGSHVHTWSSPFSSDDFDPRMHSNLRFLSRDLTKHARPTAEPQSAASNLATKASHEPYHWGGAGAWSDHTGLTEDAVDALRAAAGIELPSRATILKLLGGYLLCLVPLNYLVFRLFRRLELAWLAAPILALGAVVVVTKVAQLDIGFARRTIDLGVLELYENHPRGHLTQYIALYTSLSTNYAIEFPEVDSAALPLGDARRESRRAQSSTRTVRTNFGRTDGVVLEPVTVYSNSTEMLRSEQMVELTSPVRWIETNDAKRTIQNTADFSILGAVVLRQGADGRLQSAWLGNLVAGEQRPVQWQSTSFDDAVSRWSSDIGTKAERPEVEQLKSMQGVWTGGLLHRIAKNLPLTDGATVLIGLTSDPQGKLKITPDQEQYDRACIVVAHLATTGFGPVRPDEAIKTRSPDEDEDEEEK